MKPQLPIFLVVASALMLMAGCASAPPGGSVARDPSDDWQHGTMARLEDGVVYSLRVERKVFGWGGKRAGGLAAFDPAGGPALRGEYSSYTPSGNIRFTGDLEGNATWHSNTGNARGLLRDGTNLVIQVRMQIHQGGMIGGGGGFGEGLDNHGKHYDLRF